MRRSSAFPARRDFARFVGISVNTLSNIENGIAVSKDVENKINHAMPWISIEWLRRGDAAFLAGHVAQRLAMLAAEESDTTTPRSRWAEFVPRSEYFQII